MRLLVDNKIPFFKEYLKKINNYAQFIIKYFDDNNLEKYDCLYADALLVRSTTKIDSKLLEHKLIVLFKHPFKKDFNLIKRISTIEDGEVFLVGDNPDPNASEDSHNFGRINIKDIIAVIQEA